MKIVVLILSFLITTALFIFLVERSSPKNRVYWIVGCSVASIVWLGLSKGILASSIAFLFVRRGGYIGNYLIDYLRRMTFQVKVQAELRGQHNDQRFTNSICHRPEYVEYIDFMRKNAYFKGQKIAPFMVVCGLLGEGIENPELTEEQRQLCAALLAQRLKKVSTDQQFRVSHLFIFGELETRLAAYAEGNKRSNEAANNLDCT